MSITKIRYHTTERQHMQVKYFRARGTLARAESNLRSVCRTANVTYPDFIVINLRTALERWWEIQKNFFPLAERKNRAKSIRSPYSQVRGK